MFSSGVFSFGVLNIGVINFGSLNVGMFRFEIHSVRVLKTEALHWVFRAGPLNVRVFSLDFFGVEAFNNGVFTAGALNMRVFSSGVFRAGALNIGVFNILAGPVTPCMLHC